MKEESKRVVAISVNGFGKKMVTPSKTTPLQRLWSLKKILSCSVVIGLIASLSSCAVSKIAAPPQVINNTVNSVTLDELNLTRADYEIMNTVSASATIQYIKQADNIIKIREINDEFSLDLSQGTTVGAPVTVSSHSGVIRMGYLNNDYANDYINESAKIYSNPELLGRRLAIYRLINAAKELGGDGVIEPLITMNIVSSIQPVSTAAVVPPEIVVLEVTATAKVIKLKVD